jgi:hypothetical protein
MLVNSMIANSIKPYALFPCHSKEPSEVDATLLHQQAPSLPVTSASSYSHCNIVSSGKIMKELLLMFVGVCREDWCSDCSTTSIHTFF